MTLLTRITVSLITLTASASLGLAARPALAQTFATDNNAGTMQFVVPSGVACLYVQLYGAGGGAFGGSGAYVAGDLSVTPGETLTLLMGGGGSGNGSVGGIGGGGAGSGIGSGGGGGRSAIQSGTTELVDAAGGGGGGGLGNSFGGVGGGIAGGSGSRSFGGAGGAGGGQNMGGGNGSAFQGGNGSMSRVGGIAGGGGGGGYYGGGGSTSGGGGGGSSFFSLLSGPVSVIDGGGSIGGSYSSGFGGITAGEDGHNGVIILSNATPAAVPEASSVVSLGVLLALGLGGAAISARRRKMTAA